MFYIQNVKVTVKQETHHNASESTSHDLLRLHFLTTSMWAGMPHVGLTHKSNINTKNNMAESWDRIIYECLHQMHTRL